MNIPDFSQFAGSELPAVFIKIFDEEKQMYAAQRFFYDEIVRIEYSIEKGKNYITTEDGIYETPLSAKEIYEFLPQEDYILYSDCVLVRTSDEQRESQESTDLEELLREYCEAGFDINDKRGYLGKDDPNLPPIRFTHIGNALLNGYFEVSSHNKTVKVIPQEIEFYYHEETGTEKDYIVYHKNDKKHPERPMFKFGMLHNHMSGIDLTFEHYNEAKKTICRASALIRSYKIEDSDTLEMLEVKAEEKRPTYLPSVLLGQFGIFEGFTIRWKDATHDVTKMEFKPRHHVWQYDEEGNKLVGKQDMRSWRIIAK